MFWSFSVSFRFNSSFLFVASVPSYQLFCLARLALSSFLFVASAPTSFFRFHSFLPFVTSFLSYKLLCPDRSVFSSRFNSSFLFVASVPPYQLFCLARLALSSFLFVASAPISFFRFHSSLSFNTSFLSHKLLCPDRSVFPSVSTLPFYSLPLCIRTNSFVLLV